MAYARHVKRAAESLVTAAQPIGEPLMPPAIEFDPDATVAELWRARLVQHVHDHYAGVLLMKFPETLRVYEHLLWRSCARVVIEIGVFQGGSLLWYRDRLRTFAGYGRVESPLVIGVDVDTGPARGSLDAADPSWADAIQLIQGDSSDPRVAAAVAELVPEGAQCLVVEDSAHTLESTRGSLEQFAAFVRPGGFFVVEDGVVDIAAVLPPGQSGAIGVLPAVRAWLGTTAGRKFQARPDLDPYGLSNSPGGVLERVA